MMDRKEILEEINRQRELDGKPPIDRLPSEVELDRLREEQMDQEVPQKESAEKPLVIDCGTFYRSTSLKQD